MRPARTHGHPHSHCAVNLGAAYSDEELIVLRAVDRFRAATGNLPTDLEFFRLARALGYRQLCAADRTSRGRSPMKRRAGRKPKHRNGEPPLKPRRPRCDEDYKRIVVYEVRDYGNDHSGWQCGGGVRIIRKPV